MEFTQKNKLYDISDTTDSSEKKNPCISPVGGFVVVRAGVGAWEVCCNVGVCVGVAWVVLKLECVVQIWVGG